MIQLLEKKIEENIRKIVFVKNNLEIIRDFLYRGGGMIAMFDAVSIQ